MVLLCCFTGGTAEPPQNWQSQQQDVHLELTPPTTSVTAGRGTPVAPLPSPLPNLSIVGSGANDCVEEDRRSSPATSRNLLKLPAGAPRFSELYARLSHIRGSWHSRGVAAMHVLSQQLGLQIATLWALSSDGSFFVAQASGGPRRHALRPGASTPAALGDRQANSLQRVQASKMTTVYSCVDEGAANEATNPATEAPGPTAATTAAASATAAAVGASGLADHINYHQFFGNPHGCGVGRHTPSSIATSSQRSSKVAAATGGCTHGSGGGAPAAAGSIIGGGVVGGGGVCDPMITASPLLSRLPHDLADMVAATGGAFTDFAVLPLMSGGEVVGAVTLGLHRSQIPPQRRSGSRKDSSEGRGSAAINVAAPNPAASDQGTTITSAGVGVGSAAAVSAVAAALTAVERSPPSLTDRIRRALTRGENRDKEKGKEREDGDGQGPELGSASHTDSATAASPQWQQQPQQQRGGRVATGNARGDGVAGSAGAGAVGGSSFAQYPLPATCWLHSAASVYQLSQLAHFLGYGFFSDTEQSSFVAQSCSLVSGVSAAPDVQNLVNCLIGTTKGLIYQRFRLQAQCLVALVHSSGTTAAFFKQQRTPRGSTARAGALAGTTAAMAVQGRAQSQRDMTAQQRPGTVNAAAAAAAAAGTGVSGTAAAVASTGHCGSGPAATLPTAAALLQANLSNTSGGACGGGGGIGAGVSSSLHGLSAVLLGRKTRSQSQMRTTRSVPLQDPDNLTGYVSETMSTSVTATVISLSHTLLHDALHTQPPSGTAIRSCADALARDGAPIRDISLACRLCDSRYGAGLGGVLGEDSVNNSGTFAGHSASHAPPLSASPSMLRRSTCGRYAPLGSLIIALGLGFGAAAGGNCTGSTRLSPAGGVGARASPDGGQARILMEAQPISMGEDTSCQNAATGPVTGAIGGVSGLGMGVGVGGGGGGNGNEPLLALYVGFREVLQESVLERVLEEMTQVAELVAPTVQQRLLGTLLTEWAQMSSRLMHPSSFIGGQSVLSQGAGGGGSRRGRRRSSHEWTEALGTVELWPPSASNLSFALEDPAPLSHLQVLVNSLHSTLSSIQVERALEEGADSPLQANDMRGLELLQQIGRGGQGVVYRGRMHGIPVAVKVIPTAEGGGGMGPVDRDVAFEPDNAEAARRAARRQRALLRDALEVAASAAVAHPHLVQLHTYFTDVMVVEYEGDEGRFRLMHVADTAPGDPTGAINLVLVLEYCDGGNLRQAMERGVFFRRDARLAASPASLPAARAEAAGAGGAAAALAAAAELQPNFEFIYLTLLEVALAIRHMHAMRLAHCDLKPSNVLLRCAPHDPRGFTCKLSDFGCVQLMREVAPTTISSTTGMEANSVNAAAAVAGVQSNLAAAVASAVTSPTASAVAAVSATSGTSAASVTSPHTVPTSELPRIGFLSGHVLGTPSHLAPEAFLPGQVLDGSVDIYSFGMLMWEVVVGIPALAGLSAARVHSYTSRGLRPQFPHNTPDHYRNLAHACWAQDPRKRPNASALVVALHKALMHISPAAALEVRSMVMVNESVLAPYGAASVCPAPPPASNLYSHQHSHPHHPQHVPSLFGRTPAGSEAAAAAAAAAAVGSAPVAASGGPTMAAAAAAAQTAASGGPLESQHLGAVGGYPGGGFTGSGGGAVSSSQSGRHAANRPSSLGRGQLRSVTNNTDFAVLGSGGGGGGTGGCGGGGSAAAIAAAATAAHMPQTLWPSQSFRRPQANLGSARRRSLSAYHGIGGVISVTAAAAAASTSSSGGGAAAVPLPLCARNSIGGGSPLLMHLAQSRMSRSSRSPEPLSPGEEGPASNKGGAGLNVSPGAQAAGDPQPHSLFPGSSLLNMAAFTSARMGPAPVVPSYGGVVGAGAARAAISGLPPARPGSNGSISFGGNANGNGGYGAGRGGDANGGGSGHATEVCLATAADMVDVALVAAGRIGSGTEGRGGSGGGALLTRGSLSDFGIMHGGPSSVASGSSAGLPTGGGHSGAPGTPHLAQLSHPSHPHNHSLQHQSLSLSVRGVSAIAATAAGMNKRGSGSRSSRGYGSSSRSMEGSTGSGNTGAGDGSVLSVVRRHGVHIYGINAVTASPTAAQIVEIVEAISVPGAATAASGTSIRPRSAVSRQGTRMATYDNDGEGAGTDSTFYSATNSVARSSSSAANTATTAVLAELLPRHEVNQPSAPFK